MQIERKLSVHYERKNILIMCKIEELYLPDDV